MPEFNLIDELWIPCTNLQGKSKMAGLYEVLLGAHELRSIDHDSPLVNIALYRLLLAILHRVFGPRDLDAWFELWTRQSWDENLLSSYFTDRKDRFYMIHDEHPFYQVPSLDDKAQDNPVTKLALECASGHGATLFDHHCETEIEAWDLKKIAPYLVAFQAYAVSGGNSVPFNLSDSSLRKGICVLVTGNTLFQTLCLNLMEYNQNQPFKNQEHDLPAWEQDVAREPDHDGTIPLGYLDLLTWQSRRVVLDLQENNTCKFVKIRQNLVLPKDNSILDPMKAYTKTEKIGFLPVVLDADKAIWRDSATILRLPGAESRRPEVFNFVARIVDKFKATLDLPALGMMVNGLGVGDKAAQVILWRQEILPFHVNYTTDGTLIAALNDIIQLAERVNRLFHLGSTGDERHKTPFEILASDLVPSQGKGKKQAEEANRNDMNRIVARLEADRIYWSSLEVPFLAMMNKLATDYIDELGNRIYGEKTMLEWKHELERIAREVFSEATKALEPSGRSMKAIAHARSELNKQLKGILK